MAESPHVFIYDQLEWDDPLSALDPDKRPPMQLVDQARKLGAKRKKIVRGEGGFFMNRSVMEKGFRVPTHRHDHDELIVVITGSCKFDDGIGDLEAGDSIVIHGGTSYGFTCGDEGMDFLTIRMGEARVALADQDEGA